MTDKPMVLKELERIERYLSEAESSIYIVRDYMQEFLDDIKISDEVSDFLLDLVASNDITEEIRIKADELWKKI